MGDASSLTFASRAALKHQLIAAVSAKLSSSIDVAIDEAPFHRINPSDPVAFVSMPLS